MKKLIGIILIIMIISVGMNVYACNECLSSYGIDMSEIIGEWPFETDNPYGWLTLYFQNSYFYKYKVRGEDKYRFFAFCFCDGSGREPIFSVRQVDGLLMIYCKAGEDPDHYLYDYRLGYADKYGGGLVSRNPRNTDGLVQSNVDRVEDGTIQRIYPCWDNSGIPNEPIIKNKNYVIEIRDIQRGRQMIPYLPEHYYYMMSIFPHTKEGGYVDGYVDGELYVVDELEKYYDVKGGSIWFGKDYKLFWDITKNKASGNFFGFKFYSDSYNDVVRFVYYPYDEEYKMLYFKVDFNELDETKRNSFLVDSEEEKFVLPDEVDLENTEELKDYIDDHGYTIAPGDVWDQSEDDLVKGAQEFLEANFKKVKDKFEDVFDITNALKNTLSRSLGSAGDWEGIKVDMSLGSLPIGGKYFVVSPEPLNIVRSQLRTIIAGCMYLITAIFAIRKARDFF